MGEAFFKPRSVAVVGASGDPRKVGYAIARNLLGSFFSGDLYFVNPRRETILGRPVYHQVKALHHASEQAILPTTTQELGFPVVMRLSSPRILHKSDVGGVKVGLATPRDVEGAFYEITLGARRRFSRARIGGVLVDESAFQRVDVIVGFTRVAILVPSWCLDWEAYKRS